MKCCGCGSTRLLMVFNLAPDVAIHLCATCLMLIERCGNPVVKAALEYMQAMDFAGNAEIGKPWSEKVAHTWGMDKP